jgi:tetratricopeptide (TPR) repeat protein
MEQALADYNQGLLLDPRLAEAYFARGGWYEQNGRFSAAISDYSSAIGLQPDFAQACSNWQISRDPSAALIFPW